MNKNTSETHTLQVPNSDTPELIVSELINPLPDLGEFDQYRITEKTDIEIPQPIIAINGETVSTAGNISTYSGEGKAGKSAFTGMIIAGAISRGSEVDIMPEVYIEPNTLGKAVIHFDTEQARHNQQRNLKTILRRAAMHECPEYFLSYNIRSLELSSYQDVTTKICAAASEKFGGIHLIIIDGIADYINDVNDPKEANAIVKYFMDISELHKCPVLLVVHTNPGGDKERGHLGSQCQRKSESVIQIKKDENEISYLVPKFLRSAGKGNIPTIQFMYDREKGYHVGCGIKETEKQDSKVFSFSKVSPDIHLKLLRGVFEVKAVLTTRELRAELPKQFQTIGQSIGMTKAEAFIKEYEEKGYIVNTNTKRGNGQAKTFQLNESYKNT